MKTNLILSLTITAFSLNAFAQEADFVFGAPDSIALLREALKRNKHTAIKVINTDTICTNITDFLKARNIQQKGKQFEMIKVL